MTDKTDLMFSEILAQLKIMNELFADALKSTTKKPFKREPKYRRYKQHMLEMFEDGQPRKVFTVCLELKNKFGILTKEPTVNASLSKLYHEGKLDKLRKGIYIKKGLGEAKK